MPGIQMSTCVRCGVTQPGASQHYTDEGPTCIACFNRGASSQSRLAALLLGDLLAAAVTSAAVSFLVTPLDMALLKAARPEADGLLPLLGQEFSSWIDPANFGESCFSFSWKWLTFWLTYGAANICKTLCLGAATSTLLIFVFNSAACMVADAALSGIDLLEIPMAALAIFGIRDLLFAAATFVLPPLVAPLFGVSEARAQFAMPLLLQLFASPLHFLGLRALRPGFGSLGLVKMALIAFADYGPRVGLRMVRFSLPWSVGTIVNKACVATVAQAAQGDVAAKKTN